MKILCLYAFLIFLWCAPSSAQTQETPETSGNAFLRHCSAIDKENVAQTDITYLASCIGYIGGVKDGVAYERAYAEAKTSQKIPKLYCIPDGVENGQLVRVVLKHIRDNPADANNPTAVLVIDAFSKAYPCRAQ